MTIPSNVGWLIAAAVVVGAALDFRHQRKHGAVFPLPFIGHWIHLGILQQYVLLETILPILLSTLALTFFMLVQVIYTLADVMNHRSMGIIAEIIISRLPFIFSLTVPISVLMGTILGIGRLAVENEVRACQTAGIHLFRIFYPFILVCSVLAGGMILVNYQYGPMLQKQASSLFTRLKCEFLRATPAGVPYEFGDKQARYSFFFEDRDPKTDDMRHVRMLANLSSNDNSDSDSSDNSDPLGNDSNSAAGDSTSSGHGKHKSGDSRGQVQKLEAKVASVKTLAGALPATRKTQMPAASKPTTLASQLASRKTSKSKNQDASSQLDVILASYANITYDAQYDIIQLNLFDGAIHSSTSATAGKATDGNQETVMNFAQMVYKYEPVKPKKDVGQYTAGEIRKALRQNNLESKRNREQKPAFKVELARRTAIPLACIAFVLLGIPLAIFARPSGKAVGIAMALFLVMMYYWMVQWGSGMVQKGHDTGVLIIFLPNVLMAALGLYLFRRAIRL